jgi:hypothetical protein
MCYSRLKAEEHNLIFNDEMKNLYRVITQEMKVATRKRKQCTRTQAINSLKN